MEKLYSQSFIIKIIAIITMVIDHVGFIFFPQVWWLRLVGRVSFPLFGYLLVTGFDKTTNKTHYGIRLGLFAIVSQWFYTLIFYQDFSLNIFFTLLFAFLLLILLTKEKITRLSRWLLVLYVGVFAIILPIDYGIFGVLCIISWYYLRNRIFWLFLSQTLIWIVYLLSIIATGTPIAITSVFFLQLFSPLTIGIVWYVSKKIPSKVSWNISHKKKLFIQYGFYLFYPLHLYIIYLITLFINK
jgi:hypothetical protein